MTTAELVQGDMWRSGKCRAGAHLLTKDNLLITKSKLRLCRACADAARARGLEADARRRAESQVRPYGGPEVKELPPSPQMSAAIPCGDEDPELFFPVGKTGPALRQIAAAKAVCRRCPVRGACLRWALDSGQDHGVWGGASEDERREIRRNETEGAA